MSERYTVVNVFDENDKDKVIGWNVIDTRKDNRVVSSHGAESDARQKANHLESQDPGIDPR